jgi:beta-lactam-binding protein with PASTA domain
MPESTEGTATDQGAPARTSTRRDRQQGPDARLVWGVVAVAVVVLVAIVGAKIALSGKTGTVPNVAGLTQALATKAIEDAGFKVGRIMTQESTASAAGVVLQQAPESGVAVSKDTVVEIVVAQPVRRVKTPSVIGQKATEASSTLASAGFAPIAFGDYNATEPVGAVYGQAPAPGSDVPSGTPVVFAVSKGPRPAGSKLLVTVPSVLGQPIENATNVIKAAKLKEATVEMASDVIVPGAIMVQFPAASAKVPDGSTMLIVVSVGPRR